MPVAGKTNYKVEIHPTQGDYMDYATGYVRRRLYMPENWHYIVLILAVWLVGDAIIALQLVPQELYCFIYLLLYFVLNLLLIFVLKLKQRYGSTPSRDTDGFWNAPQVIELTEKGLSITSAHIHDEYDWRAVTEITEFPELIVLFMDRTYGYFIPKANFESPESAEEFVAAARSYHEAVKSDSRSPREEKTSYKVRVNPTVSDYKLFSKRVGRRVVSGVLLHNIVLYGLTLFMTFLAMDFLLAHDLIVKKWMFSSFGMFLGVFFLFFVLFSKFLGFKKRMAECFVAKDQYWTAPKVVEMTPRGIQIKSDRSQSSFDWQAVSEVITTRKQIIFSLGQIAGFVIPRSNFESKETENQFITAAREYLSAAKSGAAEKGEGITNERLEAEPV